MQNGTLHIGDYIVAGQVYGRVRALLDERGRRIQAAGPSTPAVVTGLSGVAEAGDVFQVMANERSARALAEERGFAAKQQQAQPVRRITLADLASQVAEGSVKTLNIDRQGRGQRLARGAARPDREDRGSQRQGGDRRPPASAPSARPTSTSPR